jgi:hypothetical protein
LYIITYAYYAGLLGRSTKNLPLEETRTEETKTHIFNWTLNNGGYPTKLTYDTYGSTEILEFEW